MNNVHNLDINVAVLIPCYNCGEAVVGVTEGCRPYANTILTVNDGSTDETAACLERLKTERIGWEINRGKGAALVEGFNYLLEQSRADVIITIDSDGQHAPADLPLFLERFRKTKADLIIGRRNFDLPGIPAVRRRSNKYSSKLIARLFHCGIRDFQTGFRLFSRPALERLLPYFTNTTFALETEMLILALKLGMKIEEIDIQSIYTTEAHSRSSWRPLVDSWRIAKVVARHWFVPKR